MIVFQIQLKETPEGVTVKYATPPAPDATKAEISVAKKLVEKLNFWIGSKAAAVELPPEPRRIVLPGSQDRN